MTWEMDRFAALDFETSGTQPEYALQPWRVKQQKAWLTSMSYVKYDGTKLKPQGKLFPNKEELRAMLQDAIDNGLTIVGWNIAFDIAWLIAYGLEDLVMQIEWLDGWLLWRHLEIEPEYDVGRPQKRSYKLKPDAIDRFLPGYGGYNEDVDFHSTDPEELRKLQKYNDRDTMASYVIPMGLYNMLAEEPQRLNAALIEARSLPMVAKANLEGLLIDTLACRELEARLALTAAEKLAVLAPFGVTEKVVRSPVQMAKLLFDDWKLPVLKENTSKKTGNTTRSTDKEVLHELSFTDPRAKTLKEYREALNNSTKFAATPLKSSLYNDDGHAHPGAIVFGTYSGRLTYSSNQGKGVNLKQTGFALHQMKRGPEFRGVVISEPGYTLMEFDASGQEFRWMAVAARDPVMLNLCMPGEDPHSYMGSRVTEQDYVSLMALVKAEDDQAKADRQLGKVANLSLQYRTSARKLRSVARVQYNIPMEMPQAQLIHTTYQKSYPGVPKYWGEQIGLTKQRGWVETFAGRRVQVVGDWTGNMGWSMGSTSINYRIQGTGADQKYLAMSVLRPYMVEHGIRFAWDLHDGIYLWVPDHKVARAAVEIKHLLDTLPYQEAWGFTPPIPMPWDCKAGGSWGSLREWKYD